MEKDHTPRRTVTPWGEGPSPGRTFESPAKYGRKKSQRSIIPDPTVVVAEDPNFEFGEDRIDDEKFPPVHRAPRQRGSRSKRLEGMDYLSRIVGSKNLNQQIKRIRGTITKTGAEAWIDKNGLGKKGYRVSLDDIDNDGIGDVTIYDKHGNPRVINGYALAPSDFLYRQYYENIDPKERGGTKNYREYFDKVYYKPTYNQYGEITGYGGVVPDSPEDTFSTRLAARGIANRRIRPRVMKSSYQAFTTWCHSFFKQLLEQPDNEIFEMPGRMKVPAPVLMTAISRVWTYGVVRTVLEQLGVENVEASLHKDPKAFPSIRSDPRFKDRIDSYVFGFLNAPDDNPDRQAVLQGLYDSLALNLELYKQSTEYAVKLAKLQQ